MKAELLPESEAGPAGPSPHPFLLPPVLAPPGPHWFSCCSRDKLGVTPRLQNIFTCCFLCLESPHVHSLSFTPFSPPPRWHFLREPFLTLPCCSGPHPASCSSQLLLLGNLLIGKCWCSPPRMCLGAQRALDQCLWSEQGAGEARSWGSEQ